MVLLDTGTPGTSREIYSEDADDGTRTQEIIMHIKSECGLTIQDFLKYQLFNPIQAGRGALPPFPVGFCFLDLW